MKSKIKKVEKIKPWGEGSMKTFFHLLEMENGDKIEIGKKKEFKEGDELDYEITGEGQEYNKAKTPQSDFNSGSGKSFDTDTSLYQTMVKEALNVVNIDGWDGKTEVKDKIEYISNIALQLAILGKKNIAILKTK